ncbi:hypothetical protein JCM10207_002167 [Rhodosporidiobolus poonsookiae]
MSHPLADLPSPPPRPRGRTASTAKRRGAAPPSSVFFQREANETEVLRQEVNRLERLVDVLISARPVAAAPSFSLASSEPALNPSLASAQTPRQLFPSPSSTASPLDPSSAADNATVNVDTDDLALQLGELTLKTFRLEEPTKPHSRDPELLSEAKLVLAADLHPLGSSPRTAAPPPEQAMKAYYLKMGWWSAVPLKQYKDAHAAIFRAVDSLPTSTHGLTQSTSLAASLSLSSSARAVPDEGRVSHWKRCARAALDRAQAIEQPSLTTLRATLVLASLYTLLTPGEEGRDGVAMLALASQACLQLDLHRDPDNWPDVYSADEAEDRRALFQAMITQDAQVASFIDRRFSLLRSDDWDTRPPRDFDNGAVLPSPFRSEIEQSYSRFFRSLSTLSDKVTRAHAAPSPLPYSRFTELESQLSDLEQSMPELYRLKTHARALSARENLQKTLVQLCVSYERFRIHRPLLSRGVAERKHAASRDTCITSARHVLELSMSPDLTAFWGCVTCPGSAAATALAIDLLFDPARKYADTDTVLLERKIKHLQSFAKVSTVARRGSRLLEFLLNKIKSRRTPSGDSSSAPVTDRKRLCVRPDEGPVPLRGSTHESRLDDEADEPPRRKSPFRPLESDSASSAHTTVPFSSSTSRRPPSPSSPSSAPSSPSSPSSSPASSSATSAPSSSGVPPPSAARSCSAAEEIAQLDFPALLGVGGTAGIFSFGAEDEEILGRIL